ncbi:MAG: Ni/Fe-hydrogenase, b-type cytochrome subunit [Wenzhouxiangellaceae bacterium]
MSSLPDHDIPAPKQSQGFLDQLVHHSTEVTSPAEKVFVYDAPVRAWHWVNAVCIVVLCITGYLIGRPPPSVPGEASMNFLFGNIRMIHFMAGHVLTIFFVYRISWAFMGNHHARQLFLPPLWSGRWWREVIYEAKWYAFMKPEAKKYIGHNPLAQLAMFTIFVLPLVHQILTGYALYAEGQGVGTWWYAAFGWVIGVYGDATFTVHTAHRLAMWVIVVFAIVHMYAAIREDIMSRQSLVSTMISGWRYFKDDRE